MGTESAHNGPHSSKLADKLDPRVDSDSKGISANCLQRHLISTALVSFTDDSAASELGDARYYRKGGNSGNTAGPHDHDIANKLDHRSSGFGSRQSRPPCSYVQ